LITPDARVVILFQVTPFVAVTAARRRNPRSSTVVTYVRLVAPMIDAQELAEALLQRRHW